MPPLEPEQKFLLPLKNIGVLVTRPRQQAANLCQLLAAEGFYPLIFPVIEIVAPENITNLKNLFAQIEQFEIIIFVSRNAVKWSYHWLGDQNLPSKAIIAAIGQGTAQELLTTYKRSADIIPEGQFNSENLLKFNNFDAIQGKKVLIVRGNGGREQLATELSNRGANVQYAEVYQRVKSNPNLDELTNSIKYHNLQVAVITSSEGLINLIEIIGNLTKIWLNHANLIVFSERTKKLARDLGIQGNIKVTKTATDLAIVETIISLFSSN